MALRPTMVEGAMGGEVHQGSAPPMATCGDAATPEGSCSRRPLEDMQAGFSNLPATATSTQPLTSWQHGEQGDCNIFSSYVPDTAPRHDSCERATPCMEGGGESGGGAHRSASPMETCGDALSMLAGFATNLPAAATYTQQASSWHGDRDRSSMFDPAAAPRHGYRNNPSERAPPRMMEGAAPKRVGIKGGPGRPCMMEGAAGKRVGIKRVGIKRVGIKDEKRSVEKKQKPPPTPEKVKEKVKEKKTGLLLEKTDLLLTSPEQKEKKKKPEPKAPERAPQERAGRGSWTERETTRFLQALAKSGALDGSIAARVLPRGK
ncbi:hypothetical protein T484DRAFT_1885284, partial [Baffinella frigidus]